MRETNCGLASVPLVREEAKGEEATEAPLMRTFRVEVSRRSETDMESHFLEGRALGDCCGSRRGTLGFWKEIASVG